MSDKQPLVFALVFALAYARLGWNVLPVWSVDDHGQCRCGRPNHEKGHKAGKHPQSDLVPHGHHDATTDEATIRDWWATDPDAGIGIELSTSGLLALDIDPQNGGGEHRLFSADSTLSYPGTLGAGLDLKHHGYICVAPTSGPSGIYQWEAGRSPLSKSTPAQPSPLPALIASKARAPVDYSLTERGGVPVATAQTFDDLRSALEHVDFDDYTTWVNVGMVLKPYGENGYKVWTEWASRSDKFDAATQRRKWERDISAPHSITYRSIFRMAIDNGWKGLLDTEEIHPLANFLTLCFDKPQAQEFILDKIIATGFTLVAGPPGAGKTSQLVPLLTRVTHLCQPNDPFKPKLLRKVIYVAEDVGQVQRILSALVKADVIIGSHDDLEDRFRLVQASRLPAEEIGKIVSLYQTLAYTNVHPKTGATYRAQPVVVFDTSNASLEIENEIDNALVGKAIATLRKAFGEIPIIVVTHVAKANNQQSTSNFSVRGASAWEGDASQVLHLQVNDDSTRWLDVENGKHRFHSDVAGVNFTPQKVSLEAIDVFGEKESLIAAFGVPHLIKSSLFSTQSKEEKVKQLLLTALSELTEKMNKEFVSKKVLFEKAKANLQVVASKSKLTGVNLADGLNALCVT